MGYLLGRFEIEDLLSNENIFESLKITETSTPLLVLIRVLIGGVKIKNENFECEQLINFFDIRNNNSVDRKVNKFIYCIKNLENILEIIYFQDEISRTNSSNYELRRRLNLYLEKQIEEKNEEVNSVLTEIENSINRLFENITNEDYSRFFISERRNTSFYESVLIEVISFLIEREKQNYILSFLYLYRAFEEIAVAYPLIYSAKNGDYLKSFNHIKDFLTNNSSGELKFLERFLELLLSEEVRESEMIFDYSEFYRKDEEGNLGDQAKELLKNLGHCIKNFEEVKITDTSDQGIYKVKFKNIFNIIINFRNRFFHKLRGSKEFIEHKESDINSILSYSLNIFIIFFAKVTLEIIKEKIS